MRRRDRSNAEVLSSLEKQLLEHVSSNALIAPFPSRGEGSDQVSAKSLLGSAGLRVVLAFAHKLVAFFAVDALDIGFL